METHLLLFLNPILPLAQDVLTTVRRGTKWSGREGYLMIGKTPKAGEELLPLARGVILHTQVFKFSDLPISTYENEHDPSCREYPGLLDAMCRAYQDFDANEVVTVVTFRVMQRFERVHPTPN